MKPKPIAKLTEKKLGELISLIYTRSCSNIQIPIMEVPKVYRKAQDAWRVSVAEGADDGTIIAAMTTAMVDYVATIRTN